MKKKHRTERVGNRKSFREKLSPAASSFGTEIFEVPPGADWVNQQTAAAVFQ